MSFESVTCLVLMPFGDEHDPFYRTSIDLRLKRWDWLHYGVMKSTVLERSRPRSVMPSQQQDSYWPIFLLPTLTCATS